MSHPPPTDHVTGLVGSSSDGDNDAAHTGGQLLSPSLSSGAPSEAWYWHGWQQEVNVNPPTQTHNPAYHTGLGEQSGLEGQHTYLQRSTPVELTMAARGPETTLQAAYANPPGPSSAHQPGDSITYLHPSYSAAEASYASFQPHGPSPVTSSNLGPGGISFGGPNTLDGADIPQVATPCVLLPALPPSPSPPQSMEPGAVTVETEPRYHCHWGNCKGWFGGSDQSIRQHFREAHELPPRQQRVCQWGACKMTNREVREHTWRHIRSHAQIPAATCPVCGKPFKREDNIPRHIRDYHPNLET